MQNLTKKQVRAICLAVCRQWLYDGKPKKGKEGIMPYAEYLRASMVKRYYKQGSITINYKEEEDV